MSYLKKIFYQLFDLKIILQCFYKAIIPSLSFFILAFLILFTSGFGIMEILRDPAQQSGASSFLGFLSNIGVWLWVSSASICFFSILFNASFFNKSHRELLLLMGLFTLLLGIDDFFMIHDRYVNQKICYLTYAVLALLIIVRHQRLIFKKEGFSFLLAGFFLALSIGTDLIQSRIPFSYQYVQIVEECFKFLGAATWLYYNCGLGSISLTTLKSVKAK